VTWYGRCCPSTFLFLYRPKPGKWTRKGLR
jgi:hypothetical protein